MCKSAGPDDYQEVSEFVFIDVDTRRTCFDVVIEDDMSIEPTEEFTLELTLDRNIIPATSSVIASPNSTTIIIRDDDVTAIGKVT